MVQSRNRLPDNTSLVMPRLVCEDVEAEMEFFVRTFEAEELNRRPGPDGKVAHGLLKISGEMIMIEGIVDATVERAVANGARVLVPLQDQFWGDRIAWFIDPAGHVMDGSVAHRRHVGGGAHGALGEDPRGRPVGCVA